MQREQRYLVLKIKDIFRSLTSTERAILNTLAAKVEDGRHAAGKSPLQCVVVESDWPEYEATWTAIASRVDGPSQASLRQDTDDIVPNGQDE